ncbi:T6SS amidase immunity protein Tai4 family protein [Burkholderia semiarida]|uniref:T6SS amidase immunity protein Tai4 family protein n=1 Tax=Burkholderia semiarida TaxID=2843303 RepID=UPI0023DD70D4|nr:T6SS amidase immunity protein Tai4 family protein [Burkholderia semiarida]MDF3092725.1 type VI secretion system amidase immunity protein Tai4 [Burkholderia semiarida]MDF3108258.1 type VI secretion system amidase immunity protein Tai4 [Burkholderia semiarida]
MGIALKDPRLALAMALAIGSVTAAPQATVAAPDARHAVERHSQKTLLKNWALSVCLAGIAHDTRDRDEANATASAYLEFGDQPIEAYDALRALTQRYVERQYSGSIPASFNTMKCIDLFHSRELDAFSDRLTKAR